MKEKKSKGLRKVFLMAVATALVIAISVSATLAYLTDSTLKRDNVFMGKGSNISGEIIEPHFTEEKTYYYSPGKETQKDPMVQNDSNPEPIYTAIKLTFYIRVDTNGNSTTPNSIAYVQVPYNTFKEYVKIKTGGVENTFNADTDLATGAGKKPWYQFNTDDANAKYFAYKTALDHADTTDNGGDDTTAAIFDSVKMSEFINIPETLAGDKTVANDLTSTRNISSAIANLTSANQYLQEFKCCDFKIKIEGFGMEAPSAGAAITDAIVSDLGSGLAA